MSVKYCTGCQHFRHGYGLEKCVHPNARDIVGYYGRPSRLRLAGETTATGRSCGPDAEWFEPKEEPKKARRSFVAWFLETFL